MQTPFSATPTQPSASVSAYIDVPVGTVVSYVGAVAPNGWLLCNGQSISASTYEELAKLVGAAVPDLSGRFLVGTGQGAGLTLRQLRDKGGDENHLLSVEEMPAHGHSMGIGGGNVSSSPGTGNSDGYPSTSTSFSAISSATGSGRKHNNMPPFYALTYIIKY